MLAINALIGEWVSYNIKYYTELTQTNTILPKIDEVGEYENYYFKYYHNDMLIFESDAYILKIAYDADNYEKEKERINQKYVYQSKPVADTVETITYVKEPSFTIDTFNMKMLSSIEYKLNYPKELVFIGTSDEKNMITYVYFLDHDLDYIDCSFEEFLREKCGW